MVLQWASTLPEELFFKLQNMKKQDDPINMKKAQTIFNRFNTKIIELFNIPLSFLLGVYSKS
ncbi:unnamed protein product [marine sediment metagenome]|uniref:Uncharacterized protein n=1 Tax=marine sediment metagenome TaxID=412755 RepID=X1HA33_9ZZZZ